LINSVDTGKPKGAIEFVSEAQVAGLAKAQAWIGLIDQVLDIFGKVIASCKFQPRTSCSHWAVTRIPSCKEKEPGPRILKVLLISIG